MMQIDSSSGGAQGDGDSRRQQIGSRTKGAGQLVSRKLDFSSQIAGFLGWSRNFEFCSNAIKEERLSVIYGFRISVLLYGTTYVEIFLQSYIEIT